jgi:gliding motility-associated-like protein
MKKKLAPIAIFTLFFCFDLFAQPCMPGWKYMNKITLSNPNGVSLANFQVLIANLNTSSLISAGKMEADGRDIRFVTVSGTILPFWVEKGTLNTSNTRVWVKVDNLAASPATTNIYLFYGNSGAFDFADGNGTFEFFDDFKGTVSEKWSTCNPSKVNFMNGQAVFTTGGTGEKVLISTLTGFTPPVVAGLKIASISGTGSGKTAFLSQHDGNQNGYALCYSPTANLIDVRPFTADVNCFTDATPSYTANFYTGNNFWQFRWISSASQHATTEGSGTTDDIQSVYSQNGFPGKVYASIGLYNDAATFTADWFFIRKYAANDNITYSFGSESTLPSLDNVVVSNNSPLCQGGGLQLSADSISGATFSWKKDNNLLPGGRTYTKTGVDTSDAGVYTLTITPSVSTTCSSYSVYEKVVVYPTTKAGTIDGAPVNVCYGSNSGSLNLKGQVGSVTRWDYSLTGGDPWYATGNTLSTQNYTNLSSTTTYRVIVQSGTCLEQITPAATVTVDALPVAGSITGAKNICQGQDISLTIAGYTGTIEKWMYSADSIVWNDYLSNQETITFNGLAATTWYKATVTNGTCGEATTEAIKVEVGKPTVAGSFDGTTVCLGSSGNLLLTGYTGKIIRWEMSLTGGQPWATIASTSATLAYDNATQTTWYRAVVQNGACNLENSEVDTVMVDQPVVTGKLTGSDTVCTGNNTGKLILTGYSGIISKWQLSSDGTSWADIINNTDTLRYTNLTSKRYYRTYLNSYLGACPLKISDSAYVAISPATVGGIVIGSASVCATSNKGTLKLSGQTGNVLRWERSPSGYDPWFVIANTTDSLPYLDLPETTWYRAVIQSGDCQASPSGEGEIKVTQPSVSGSITGADHVCAENNDGTLILTGFTGEVKKWQKTTDLSSWTLAIHSEPTELDYKNLTVTTNYRAIVQNGICPADTTPTTAITIYPLPVVKFTTDTVNLGQTTHFANLSSIVSGSLVTFDWDFGNGYSSSARNPVFIYTRSGTYQVKLNVTSDKGCLDSITNDVLVYPLPKPGFNFTNVCFKDTMSFTNTSSITAGDMFYYWYFGDGGVSEEINATHYYAASGTYYVKLVAESDIGSRDSITQEVTVYPRATPDFSFTNVCNGTTSSFINKSGIVKGSLSYLWNFGDGTITAALNPDQVYENAGKYQVTLISTSDKGCMDTIVKTVTVFPLPIASFKCDNVPYNNPSVFIDSSVVQEGNIVKWSWNFGDAGTAFIQDPTHLYAAPGVYLVNLKVQTDSGCSGSFSKNVEIYALPNAAFSFANACFNDSVRFTNTSSIASGSITCFWDFGDQTSSALKAPSHYYETAGFYVVTLMVTSDKGGKDTAIQSVTVYPKPVPGFVVPNVCDGFLSSFQNTSTIITGTVNSYNWDFGDGTNSVQTNPVKQFLNPGIYQVTLKAVSDNGCTDKVTISTEMYVAPVANFTVDQVCLGTKVDITNLSNIESGTLQYQWDFGDGNSSIDSNPEHLYLHADTFSIKLIANSDHNCKDSVTRRVIVHPVPTVDAGADTSVVMGFSVQLKATGGIIYDWSPTEGLDNSVIAAPIARPKETTIYTVRITDEYSCVNSDSVRVSVIDNERLIPTNVITPNGDGINDTWHITNIDFYEQATVKIFNRWGELVYEKTGYQQDWDGKNNNGDVLPDGTYYYVINFPHSTKYYSGAITILRDK